MHYRPELKRHEVLEYRRTAQAWISSARLEFLRENITQADLELLKHHFQLVQGQVMFSAFDAVQGGVRETDLL